MLKLMSNIEPVTERMIDGGIDWLSGSFSLHGKNFLAPAINYSYNKQKPNDIACVLLGSNQFNYPDYNDLMALMNSRDDWRSMLVSEDKAFMYGKYQIKHEFFGCVTVYQGLIDKDNYVDYSKCFLQMSGSAIEQFNRNTARMMIFTEAEDLDVTQYLPIQLMLRGLWKYHDFKCTRIDLRIDGRNFGINIQECIRAVKSGRTDMSFGTFSEVTNSDGSATLYLGSKKADLFIRLYDKAKEQHVDGIFKQLKEHAYCYVHDRLKKDGLEILTESVYQDLFDENGMYKSDDDDVDWKRVEIQSRGNQAESFVNEIWDMNYKLLVRYIGQAIYEKVLFYNRSKLEMKAWKDLLMNDEIEINRNVKYRLADYFSFINYVNEQVMNKLLVTERIAEFVGDELPLQQSPRWTKNLKTYAKKTIYEAFSDSAKEKWDEFCKLNGVTDDTILD